MKTKQRTGHCAICGKNIDASFIRCAGCDVAWQEGNEAGRETTQAEIRCLIDKFKQLVGIK